VLGGKLPIDSSQADHYGNDSIFYQPVRSGLMYQWGNYDGNRFDIGQLDLLILKDLGYSIKNYTNLPIVDPIDKFNIFGTNDSDCINANLQSSKIIGYNGNDTINLPKDDGGYGNYLIDGGDGYDATIINQQRSSFSLLREGSSYILRDKTGANGVSILVSIENIKFTDGSLVFDVANTADHNLVYRLYQSAFARTPDEGGFRFWSDAKDKGASINSIASSFLGSAEFTQKYGANLANNDYVHTLYKNVLGREPDAAGLKFWQDSLNSNSINRDDALINFANSAENVKLTEHNVDNGYWLI
jgi:hypothetical protein